MSEHIDTFSMLETAMEAAGMAWWWMELPSGVVIFSPSKTRMIDREAVDFVHYKSFVNIVHLDDRDRIMKAMYDLFEGRVDYYETHYRIQKTDGEYVRFFDRGRIVGGKDGEVFVAGIVLDLNQFKNLRLIED